MVRLLFQGTLHLNKVDNSKDKGFKSRPSHYLREINKGPQSALVLLACFLNKGDLEDSPGMPLDGSPRAAILVLTN